MGSHFALVFVFTIYAEYYLYQFNLHNLLLVSKVKYTREGNQEGKMKKCRNAKMQKCKNAKMQKCENRKYICGR